jgi:hypothetical protein
MRNAQRAAANDIRARWRDDGVSHSQSDHKPDQAKSAHESDQAQNEVDVEPSSSHNKPLIGWLSMQRMDRLHLLTVRATGCPEGTLSTRSQLQT